MYEKNLKLYKKIKILIVDDEAKWQNLHINSLKDLIINSEITIASSANEALNILENKNYQFDYITTDLQMEQKESFIYAGEWLLNKIKKSKKFNMTNVAVISAANNIDSIARKYNAKFISKISALTSIKSYLDFVGHSYF